MVHIFVLPQVVLVLEHFAAELARPFHGNLCPCEPVHKPVVFHLRMEDGMDESKYKASFDGQLGAGTAGPGANFA